MSKDTRSNLTLLLKKSSQGDVQALDLVMAEVYSELRRMARFQLRKSREGTLQPTALVNEAFIRLVGQESHWQNRAHFFSVASTMMRRIFCDHAKAKLTQKRGGNQARVLYEEELHAPSNSAEDMLELDLALKALEAVQPRQAKVVEMKYFGGLTNEEIAEALSLSLATVKREWSVARAWLYRELSAEKKAA